MVLRRISMPTTPTRVGAPPGLRMAAHRSAQYCHAALSKPNQRTLFNETPATTHPHDSLLSLALGMVSRRNTRARAATRTLSGDRKTLVRIRELGRLRRRGGIRSSEGPLKITRFPRNREPWSTGEERRLLKIYASTGRVWWCGKWRSPSCYRAAKELGRTPTAVQARFAELQRCRTRSIRDRS
jgi:hypothetical protein